MIEKGIFEFRGVKERRAAVLRGRRVETESQFIITRKRYITVIYIQSSKNLSTQSAHGVKTELRRSERERGKEKRGLWNALISGKSLVCVYLETPSEKEGEQEETGIFSEDSFLKKKRFTCFCGDAEWWWQILDLILVFWIF